jgi:hypothetical protein
MRLSPSIMSSNNARQSNSEREQRELRQVPRTSFQNPQAAVGHNLGTVNNNFGGLPWEGVKPGTPVSTALSVHDGQFVRRHDIFEILERIFVAGSRVALVGPAGSGLVLYVPLLLS